MPRKILLNPGPCTTSERVKQALLMPDLCPREHEFGHLVAAVRAKLLAVAHATATHSAVLIAGSGTAAVEAALASLLGPADHLLIIDNGAYGRRAAQIAAAHGRSHRVLGFRWGEYPEPGLVAAALAATPRPTHCFFVHHETTTGMLNPLPALAAACRAHGVVSIVDAISSLGGVSLDLSATPVDCLVGSANKCLQGLPGIAFALVTPAQLARAATFARRSLYLHLPDLWHAQETTRQFLYTPPVQVLHALDAALEELFAEGLPARHARYAACHTTLLDGMSRLGFACLLPRRWQSGLLTAFHEPTHPAWDFAALHDWLYARDVTVYPGKLDDTRTFRLANLGDLTPADIAHSLDLLGDFLLQRRLPLPPVTNP